MGRAGAQAKLNVRGNEPSFQAIIDEVQSVRTVPRPGQPQPAGQADAEMRSALVEDEEEKQPDVDFDSMPNPIQELNNLISPQEMSWIFLGMTD